MASYFDSGHGCRHRSRLSITKLSRRVRQMVSLCKLNGRFHQIRAYVHTSKGDRCQRRVDGHRTEQPISNCKSFFFILTVPISNFCVFTCFTLQDGADIVVCKMSKSDSGICHFYANQFGFEEATGKSLGLSNTKVIVSNDTKRLTCSFTRDNSVNPKSVDYSHTLISVAYGQGKNFFACSKRAFLKSLQSFFVQIRTATFHPQ